MTSRKFVKIKFAYLLRSKVKKKQKKEQTNPLEKNLERNVICCFLLRIFNSNDLTLL